MENEIFNLIESGAHQIEARNDSTVWTQSVLLHNLLIFNCVTNIHVCRIWNLKYWRIINSRKTNFLYGRIEINDIWRRLFTVQMGSKALETVFLDENTLTWTNDVFPEPAIPRTRTVGGMSGFGP